MTPTEQNWHLMLVKNDDSVELVKAFLTKEQAVFRANRLHGNPCTPQEENELEERVKEWWRRNPRGGCISHGLPRAYKRIEVWHADEWRDEELQRVVIVYDDRNQYPRFYVERPTELKV